MLKDKLKKSCEKMDNCKYCPVKGICGFENDMPFEDVIKNFKEEINKIDKMLAEEKARLKRETLKEEARKVVNQWTDEQLELICEAIKKREGKQKK